MMKPLKSSNHRDSHPSGAIPLRLSALRMTFTSIHFNAILNETLRLLSGQAPFSEGSRFPLWNADFSVQRDSHPSGTMSALRASGRH
jgi:hypothetical protein